MSCRKLRNCLSVMLLLGLVLLTTAQPAKARFARPQLNQVPIHRLIENLSAKVKGSPKDAGLRRNLARAHAMAYANKGADVKVGGFGPKKTDSIWFGYTPKFIPFTVRAAADDDQKKKAKQQLDAAVAQYREAIKLAPDDIVSKLGLAWILDQAGEKKEAKKLYRATIKKSWDKEGRLRGGRLGGNYITVEAGGYLVALLDPKSDGAEIAEINQRRKKLTALPKPVTPIAVPLHDGLTDRDFHNLAARVPFDADGTGLRNRWTWLNKKAGWLVYDVDGRGKISSASQMFGSVTFMMFWENGYDALSSLDDNHDGRIAGAELAHLAIWHDANGNGVSEKGEVRPLADYSIRQLGCDHRLGDDGVLYSPHGVIFSDGTHRPTFDVILQPHDERR